MPHILNTSHSRKLDFDSKDSLGLGGKSFRGQKSERPSYGSMNGSSIGGERGFMNRKDFEDMREMGGGGRGRVGGGDGDEKMSCIRSVGEFQSVDQGLLEDL